MPETKPSTASLADAGRALEGAFSRMLYSAFASSDNLSTHLNRLPVVRNKTLEILVDLTPEQAAWSARSGSWSIAQIADHLLRSEELYREQFHRMIQMAKEGQIETIVITFDEIDTQLAVVPRSVASALQFPMRVLNRFIPTAVRETLVRYPLIASLNPKVSAPRPELNLEKLRSGLSASMAETLTLFEGQLPRDLERIRVDHPLLGYNNIVDMFRILLAHEERHQGQMKRAREHPNFPKA